MITLKNRLALKPLLENTKYCEEAIWQGEDTVVSGTTQIRTLKGGKVYKGKFLIFSHSALCCINPHLVIQTDPNLWLFKNTRAL